MRMSMRLRRRPEFRFWLFSNDSTRTPTGFLWIIEPTTGVGIHCSEEGNFLATLGILPFSILGIFEPADTNIFNIEETKMTRRAVIYIRTSSETQGENSSPIEQEADCLHLAKEKGLSVVCVYRDVEKYRVGNSLPYINI
jgi:hypothetical protein